MNDDHTYNGWKNYETWAVALWIDQEEPTYHMRQEWAHDARQSVTARQRYGGFLTHLTDRDAQVSVLSSVIKEYVEDNNPLNDEPSLYSDLLNGAISEVNWHEIAEHWMEEEYEEHPEADEEEEEEEEEDDEDAESFRAILKRLDDLPGIEASRE